MRAIGIATCLILASAGGVYWADTQAKAAATAKVEAQQEAQQEALWRADAPERQRQWALAQSKVAEQEARDQEARYAEMRAASEIQQAYEATHFGGYPCKTDCSGHRAGYAWAERRGLESEDDCEGKSQSFIEGCYVYVDEQAEEAQREEGRARARYLDDVEACDTDSDISNETCREEFESIFGRDLEN